jgi:phosphoribosylanthranilate isomerase
VTTDTALPRVKVCCIASREEAQLAIAHGVSAIGLVSAMPSGPGVIDEAQIAHVARAVPPGVASFLLTSLHEPLAIIAQQRRCSANTIQLVDHLPSSVHTALRAALPGIAIVQVVHVADEQSVAYAVAIAPFVDALLLDSGNPTLAVKELGGTGRTHDWQISRHIRETVAVPVYLAGGLRPDNVNEALETVQPFGLDVCTGVRTHGALDARKLAAFMAAVRNWTAGATIA